MIFGNQLLPKVLDQSKTVTRRPVKTKLVEPFGGWIEKGRVQLPCKYKVGRTYGVQPVIKEGPGKCRGGSEGVRMSPQAGSPCKNPPTPGFDQCWTHRNLDIARQNVVRATEARLAA